MEMKQQALRLVVVLAGAALVLFSAIPAGAGYILPHEFNGTFTINEGQSVSLSGSFAYDAFDYISYYQPYHCLFSNSSICYYVPGTYYYGISDDHITSGTYVFDNGSGTIASKDIQPSVTIDSFEASFVYHDEGTYQTTSQVSVSYTYTAYGQGCQTSYGGPSNPYCGQYYDYNHATSGSTTLPQSGTVSVLNVAPTITSLTSSLTAMPEETFDFSASATDLGIYDVLTYAWDLDGDGQYDDFYGSSGQWSYSTAGVYSVGLQVSDGDGGYAYETFTVTVPTPEPSTWLLMGTGLVSLLGYGRRRKKQIA